ncbi:MAG: DUF3043 domain-containing protein [Salinibacterium sp.]|nr:DUF3043 domain-containing protein [Salinibacterium sp.]MBF0671037.1 DUF3043 domain-containing protein [Salinibacterium sp.]
MAKPAPESQPAVEADEQGTTTGKGRPTPTRKEREAANLRPLVSNDRKAANREARAKYNEARDRARVGMANGEERYLPQRDKGPQRRYVRDYVDARFSIGELMIPVMLLVIVLTIIPDPMIAIVSMAVLWGFFILAVLDCVIAGLVVTKRLKAKFGEDKVEKVRWYTAMRCLQMRPMRLPKPQVKRGQYPA